jgi:hypothetical protein
VNGARADPSCGTALIRLFEADGSTADQVHHGKQKCWISTAPAIALGRPRARCCIYTGFQPSGCYQSVFGRHNLAHEASPSRFQRPGGEGV